MDDHFLKQKKKAENFSNSLALTNTYAHSTKNFTQCENAFEKNWRNLVIDVFRYWLICADDGLLFSAIINV